MRNVFVWYNKHTNELELIEEVTDVTFLAHLFMQGYVYIGKFY